MRAKGVKGQNTLKQHGFAGADTGFSKGGVETSDTKCGGGGGVLSGASGPIQKAGRVGGGGGGSV